MSAGPEDGPALDPGTSMQVLHAVDMVVSLIEPAFDESLDIHVQRACRESFAMNARLLAEFHKDKKSARLTAFWYLDRELDLGDEAKAVGCLISWASDHVAHLDREARAAAPVVPLTPHDLADKATLVVSAMRRFADALAEQGHGEAKQYEAHLSAASERLAAVVARAREH